MQHPHFDNLGHVPSPSINARHHYRSKASGLNVIVEHRTARATSPAEWVALPAMYDGSLLPVHAEPLAWAEDEWDVLDKIHAMR